MYKITVPTVITNGHFNKEKTLKELKRAGAHRVCLALEREFGYEFSSPENLALLKELIDYFRSHGFETLVWLGESLGHGAGKPFAGSKYGNMRTFERGEISPFCPLDESFGKAIVSWVKKIALCSPDMMMFDDDFRFLFHGGIACCCDLHMKAFCDEIGEEIRREELYPKLFSGKGNRYRSAWMKVQGESLKSLAKKARNALDEVNPDIRLGLCSCVTWDAEGWDPADMAKILAGNTKPFLRPPPAPYNTCVENKTRLGEIVEVVRRSLDHYKGQGIELMPEGDTYPRPRQECPAALLECYDMIIRADGSADGMLKYMLDYVGDADYETGYVDAAVRNADIYKMIEEHFSGKKATGVKPYAVMHIVENADLGDEKFLVEQTQNSMRQPVYIFTALNLLPTSYEDGSVNVLFGENVRYITGHELKNGNIIDLTAAKILMERGIDVGIEKILDARECDFNSFTALPSEYFIDEGVYTRLDLGVTVTPLKLCDGARVKSNIVIGKSSTVGTYEYENKDGMRFLVLAFDSLEAKFSTGWLYGYARSRELIRSIEWLGRKPLDAYVEGNYPDMYVMTKKDENSLTVGIWNTHLDRADGVKIVLSKEYGSVKFLNCQGELEGKCITLKTPIYPYEFAGVELS